MKNKLKRLPGHIQDCIREVSSQAAQSGVRVYLVGGMVRDLIIGRKDFDLDFVAEGDGIALGNALARRLKAEGTYHKRFGTATVKTDQCKIDIASARKETYHSCGCLPEVSFSALKDDLFRRDFTINAMAVGVNQDDYGRLIDYYGGYRDLKRGIIRILHKRSFIDDPTRIFRAVRFKERFHFVLERETLRHLKEAVDSGVLSYIDEHRIRNELVIILSEPLPRRYIRTLQQWCALDFFKKNYRLSRQDFDLIREVDASVAWYASLHERITAKECKNWLVYLCALLRRFTPKELAEFCLHFGMRSADRETILFLPQAERIAQALEVAGALPSAVYFTLQPLSLEAIVYIYACARRLRSYKEVRGRIGQYLAAWRHTRLHLNGEDLKKLKIHPPVMYNKIFRYLLKRTLDGYIHTREEEEQEALRAYHMLVKQ